MTHRAKTVRYRNEFNHLTLVSEYANYLYIQVVLKIPWPKQETFFPKNVWPYFLNRWGRQFFLTPSNMLITSAKTKPQ